MKRFGIFRGALAWLIPFDNSSNGFTSTDVQAAIEEAKATAAGKLRDSRYFIMNGTVSNGDWLAPSNLISDYKYIMTENLKFYGLSWSCGNGDGRSFDLEFYKNGTDPGDLFYTYEVRNSTNDWDYITGLNYTFQAGDYMEVKYVDQGLNVSDFAGRFLMEVL